MTASGEARTRQAVMGMDVGVGVGVDGTGVQR